MPDPISCLHLEHINAAIVDYDASVSRFTELYGAHVVLDMPRKEWHSNLMAFGGNLLFELYCPWEELLTVRPGPHYVGVEYQVADVDATRQAVLDGGRRIIREQRLAFHTHPADCVGIAWEFYGEHFHADPPPVTYDEPLRPLSYWSDEHPLGCLGLKRYSVAVHDVDAARNFHQEFVDGQVCYELPRPAIGANAVGIALADTVVELLSPTGPGVISDHVARWGDGIRAIVFQVKDLEAARTHFASKGVTLVAGDAPDSLAIRPEDNAGLLFEFCE